MLTAHISRFVGGSAAIAALAVLSACGANTHESHGVLDPAGARPAAAVNRHLATPSSSAASSPAPHAPSATTPVATTPSPSAPTAAPRSAAPGTSADGGYQGAQKLVERMGFDPEIAPWHADHRLNAIGGVLKASADGHFQRVFFFVNGRYIGLDSTQPSGSVQVANTSYDLVTVTYAIYQPSDALCCPSSRQSVRYQWTGTKLVPLDPIPPVATGTAAGR